MENAGDAAPKWSAAAAAGERKEGFGKELLASLDDPEALQAAAHVEEANETLKIALHDALVYVEKLKRDLDRERKKGSQSRSKSSG